MNAAANVALIAAAQQQAASAKAITDQLHKANAYGAAAAVPLDLSLKMSDKMLQQLIDKGHVRAAGGELYWLDREAVERSKANATRWSLIAIAFLLSLGASLLALLLTR